ncbi:MAG TPA: mismatch-specific DNA-glycosylase [Mycobacteriales bacterium]|nr:mismatch-specific DNA-glycosylase [Mycobacteriales bacterium]
MVTARPTREELTASYGVTIPDLGGPDTQILMVGINPSLWSAWSGHHFARPGNRFWRTLHTAGLTPTLLEPSDEAAVRAAGLGITNLVARATARADELSDDDVRAGVEPLRRLVGGWKPDFVAFLGISTYRIAFNARKAAVGEQPGTFEASRVWVLPNPSGLNAHYQQPALTAAYAELTAAAGRTDQMRR